MNLEVVLSTVIMLTKITWCGIVLIASLIILMSSLMGLRGFWIEFKHTFMN